MAGIDPYGPCPCGSGQKFKWCCQKVEAYADRAQRLLQTGQTQAAIDALDEGLRKEPANAWLLTRKALVLVREGKPEEAKATLRKLLQVQPQHVAGHALLVRAVLESEGPLAGIAELQHALTSVSEADRPGLASMIGITGSLLARLGHYPAALAHLALARKLTARPDQAELPSSVEESILGNASILPWLKDHYRLSPAPAGLDPERSRQFNEAIGWAESGLWASAAAAFESLSAVVSGPEADRNVGLCRLWMADDPGAVQALRRAIKKLGTTEQAVDLEALCQLISPAGPDDRVELVQLIWPLRDRDALLKTLRAQKDVVEEGPAPIDSDDPESPEVQWFALLDRPAPPPSKGTGLKPSDIPRVLGRVAVGGQIAALEAHDDGKLDALSARFTAMAGSAIPPAHPKTKVIDHVSRVALALSFEWLPPEGIDPAEIRRLSDEEQSRIVTEVWPETKLPYLGNRTPRQAAKAGDAVVPLRAACCQFEWQQYTSSKPADIAALRASLGIPPEPEVDPATVDPAALPFPRFAYVPAERLDDERLLAFSQIAREASLVGPLERADRALASRPHLIEGGKVPALAVFSELALAAAGRSQFDEAFRWVEQGRRLEPAADRTRTAPAWDLLEVRIRARFEDPEVWVPEVAVVLERYRDNTAASQTLMLSLLEMGLLRMVPNPDNPQELMIDPRPLQALLAEFGPRVTTASGELGISATKGGIWTPDSQGATSSGGIWTPGSAGPAPSGGADKPKLIIPGR
ncbi:MAG TPA: tetratricopeptide repeat protein [Isosphaeraceae bacterium]